MTRPSAYPACLAVVTLLAACHQRTRAVPVIASLTPAAGDIARTALIDVTIAGRGFDSLNTVHFGRVLLRQVPRTSATSLRFTVPRDDEQIPDRGAAPVTPLASGIYAVKVTTQHGTSNALPFTLSGMVR
jgi:hypothetical protein